MTLLIILGSFIGIIISIALGTLWHSPLSPFGKIHMEYLGFDKLTKEQQDKKIEETKPHMWKVYTKQAFLSGITSAALAYMVLTFPPEGGNSFIYLNIIALWVAFVVPLIGQNLLWGPCEDGKLQMKKFFGDSLYQLVTYLLIVFVLSFVL
jgi:hypothetical protein